MKSEQAAVMERLIQLGICRASDVRQTKIEAEKLSSPEYGTKIRQAEKLLGAIADPTRIKVILLLSGRELCVCGIESALGLPQPTVSHHLGILEQAGLLQRTKKERWVFYKVRQSPAVDLLRDLVP